MVELHPAMKSPTMARKPTLPVCRGCGRLSALTAIPSRETSLFTKVDLGVCPGPHFNHVAFCASLAHWKPGNFLYAEPRDVRDASPQGGALPVVSSAWAFPGPQVKHGREDASPFFRE